MRGKISDVVRLQHILEAAGEIISYTKGATFEGFKDNSMMLFATIKQLEIIGEAANSLSEETRAGNSEIPWRKIIGLRHILVHEYFAIDRPSIWLIVQEKVPEIQQQVSDILKRMTDENP